LDIFKFDIFGLTKQKTKRKKPKVLYIYTNHIYNIENTKLVLIYTKQGSSFQTQNKNIPKNKTKTLLKITHNKEN